MGFLLIVLIGFVAGIIVRLLSSAPNKPAGFILTTALGIAGAFLATFVGQGSVGTRLTRARVSSPRRLVRSLCCSFGTASLLRVPGEASCEFGRRPKSFSCWPE